MKQALRLFLVLFLIFGLCAPALADALVSLRPMSEIKGAAIRLGDVFDGVPKEVDVDIAIAPEPGKSVTYNAQVLIQLAQQYHLIWRPQSASDAAVLTRAYTEVSADKIREAIERKIKDEYAKKADSIEVQFDNRQVGFFLPADQESSFEVVSFSYDARNRRFHADIAAPAGSSFVKQRLTGRVSVKKEIPVLARRVTGQTVLGAGDLTWRAEAEERLPRDVLTDAAQIVGLELRTDGNEGDMLRMRDLLPPRLVTRGSLVTLKVETPLMQITVRGRSLGDGAKGDVVRVTNMQSKRVVEGVVEADGIVRVDLTQKIASVE